jgi:hypothetical protein
MSLIGWQAPVLEEFLPSASRLVSHNTKEEEYAPIFRIKIRNSEFLQKV